MNIEYDPETDGAYLWLLDIEGNESRYHHEVRPAEFHDEVGFLLDEFGKIIGIEIQPASKYLEKSLLEPMAK